jgi:hypothetical protein
VGGGGRVIGKLELVCKILRVQCCEWLGTWLARVCADAETEMLVRPMFFFGRFITQKQCKFFEGNIQLYVLSFRVDKSLTCSPTLDEYT